MSNYYCVLSRYNLCMFIFFYILPHISFCELNAIIINQTNELKTYNNKIISHIKITDIQNKHIIFSSQVTLYNENDYLVYLTKIDINSNNICLVSNNTDISLICLNNSIPVLKKVILLIENEGTLLNIINNINNTNNSLLNYNAIIYNNNLASYSVHQTLSKPLFLINNNNGYKLQNIINHHQVTDVSIEVLFDNTNYLLPYTFLTCSKYFPLLSIILIICSLFAYKNNTFLKRTKLCLSLILFMIFITIYLLTNSFLTYINDNFSKAFSISQSIYEIFYNIFKSIYLSILYTLIIFISNGLFLLFSFSNSSYARKQFFIFISLYINFSIDSLFRLIKYNVFNTLSVCELKNIIVIIIVYVYCISNTKFNIKQITFRLMFAVVYTRSLYDVLLLKVLFYKVYLKFLYCALFANLLCLWKSEYQESFYYKYIRMIVKEDVDCFISLCYILVMSFYWKSFEVLIWDDYKEWNDMDLNKQYGIYKWNGRILGSNNMSLERKEFIGGIKKKCPIVVLDPLICDLKENEILKVKIGNNIYKNMRLGFVLEEEEQQI